MALSLDMSSFLLVQVIALYGEQVMYCAKQGRRDLNPQPLVLETSALPIELHP